MDYKEILAQSVQHINYRTLFDSVSASKKDFLIVFDLMWDTHEKVAWHAGWICEKVSEKKPSFFTKKHIQRIIELSTTTPFTGLQRLLLSMVLNLPMPTQFPVEFIDTCFERMISMKSPTAVQVLSMKILYEIVKKEPDFLCEFKAYLESVEVEYYTVGYKSARNKILNNLNNKTLKK
ncbi:hypothetical protein LJB95_00220 [Paludibacteraceae bacterium OttesenSCG-928-F17]|nr:hypothetical protein [Paludibacteraceae bacterium OttesenSCG-928-F17]